jgi:hypothetical protein
MSVQEAVVSRGRRRAYSFVLVLLALLLAGVAVWSALGVIAPDPSTAYTVRYIPFGIGHRASSARIVMTSATASPHFLKLGERVSQDGQILITIAVMTVMVVGLTPKRWKVWRRWL